MQPASKVRGPFLLDPVDSSIFIQWETTIADGPNAVDFRRIDVSSYTRYLAVTTTMFDWSGSPHYIHTARIPSYSPGSSHAYRLIGYQYQSPTYSFTPPSASSATDVLVVGGIYGSTSALSAALAYAPAVNMYISLGNLFPESTTDPYETWGAMMDVFGSRLTSVPLIRVRGATEQKCAASKVCSILTGSRAFRYGTVRYAVPDAGQLATDAISAEFESNSWATAGVRVVLSATSHATLLTSLVPDSRVRTDSTATRDLLRQARPTIVLTGGARSYQRGVMDATDGIAVTAISYFTGGSSGGVIDRVASAHDRNATGVQFVRSSPIQVCMRMQISSVSALVSAYDLGSSTVVDSTSTFAQPLR